MSEPAVYLVDDDDSVRAGLTDLLEASGHAVVAFARPAAFVAALDARPRGCAILDIRMPGIGGLDLQRMLAEREIDLPLIFLTGHADIPMCVQAMQAGASDFLTKPFREQDVLDAVAKAKRRHRDTHEDNDQRKRLAVAYASLTPRERFIMSAAAGGRLNKVIAAELKLSEISVKLARAKMMRKMGATSIAELAVLHHLLRNGDAPRTSAALSFERGGSIASRHD